MTCANCSPANTDITNDQFANVRFVIEDVHEWVAVVRCVDCGGLWLRFGVEIYDEIGTYWAPLAEAQAGQFLAIESPGTWHHPLFKECKATIQEAASVLAEFPRGEFFWILGRHAALDGPPW